MDDSLEKNKTEATGKESTRERLHGWIEQGFNDRAIAVYGASARIFKSILNTGRFPPYPITLDYQRKLFDGDNKHLYYALPIFERIAKVRPQLAENIVSLYPNLDYSFELVKNELSADNARNTARGYALRQSQIDSFYEKTGIKVDDSDIYVLAMDVIQRQFESFGKETLPFNFSDFRDKEALRIDADTQAINAIRARFTKEQLADILSLCLQRRGVLIYLNTEIFEGNRVLPGKESENEIMIIADKPLSISTISGIEVLSDVDMQAVQKHL